MAGPGMGRGFPGDGQTDPEGRGAKEGISRVSEVGEKLSRGPRGRRCYHRQWGGGGWEGWESRPAQGAGGSFSPSKVNSAAAAQEEVFRVTVQLTNRHRSW